MAKAVKKNEHIWHMFRPSKASKVWTCLACDYRSNSGYKQESVCKQDDPFKRAQAGEVLELLSRHAGELDFMRERHKEEWTIEAAKRTLESRGYTVNKEESSYE